METKHHKEWRKIFDGLQYNRHNVDKFKDFCKMSAYSLALPFYPELAKKELKIFETLTRDELIKYDKLFSITVEALESQHQDFLGELFGSYNMGNSYRGQFFTPYNVSLMMAQMTLGDLKPQIEEKGFLRISEPASGAGCMIIAVSDVFLNQGCNPSTDMYVEMIDVDELAFLMSYIQISLYGIAAKVIHGNAITREMYRELFTPVYFLNNWAGRIAFRDLLEMTAETSEPINKPESKALPGTQLTLF